MSKSERARILRTLGFAAWAASLPVGGCATEPTRPFVGGGDGTAIGLETAWQARGLKGVSIPATDASQVYVRATGGVVQAFDKHTGVPRWRQSLPADATLASPALVATAGVVLIGADPTILALDALTGAERWRFRGDADLVGTSTPAVDDSTMYVAALTGTGRLYAVNARTGQTRWSTSVAPPTRPDQVAASSYDPVLDTERVYVTYTRFYGRDQGAVRQGGVGALSRRSGEVIWRYEYTRRDPPLDASTAHPYAAAVHAGVVVAASSDGWVYGLDARTGVEQWRLASLPRDPRVLGQSCMVGAGAGTAVAGCGAGQFRGVDIESGKLLWQHAVQHVGTPTTVNVDGDVAFVGFLGQSLVALDLRTGTERWRFQASDLVGFAFGARPDGQLVYAAGDPGLVALRR